MYRHYRNFKHASVQPALNRDKDIAYTRFLNAQKAYHATVRAHRRKQGIKRDEKLFEILSNNPMKVYQFIKRSKRNNISKINHLKVGDKVYTGDDVADGFYDSLTTLKSCNFEELKQDQNMDVAICKTLL